MSLAGNPALSSCLLKSTKRCKLAAKPAAMKTGRRFIRTGARKGLCSFLFTETERTKGVTVQEVVHVHSAVVHVLSSAG